MALDALDAILRTGEETGGNFAVLVDEAEGLDKLEQLQEHQNSDIYEKAVNIIEKFFGTEGEEENVAPNATGNQDGFAFTGVDTSQGFNFPAAAPLAQQPHHGFN